MGAAASGEIAADFGNCAGSGILVADIISDLGIFSSTVSGSLLCFGIFGLLAVSISVGGGAGAGRTFQDSGSAAV